MYFNDVLVNKLSIRATTLSSYKKNGLCTHQPMEPHTNIWRQIFKSTGLNTKMSLLKGPDHQSNHIGVIVSTDQFVVGGLGAISRRERNEVFNVKNDRHMPFITAKNKDKAVCRPGRTETFPGNKLHISFNNPIDST